MGPYGFCLALGLTGLAVMAFLGFAHHGPGNGHASLGHHGGAAGHGAAAPDASVGHGHAGSHGHDAGHGEGHSESALGRLTSLLSPRVLFSFLVGLGATGLILKSLLIEPLTVAAALFGGFLFERFLVGPVWNFLFRFESRPAALLESAILEEARAAADFDSNGQGLIQLELDGQVLQLLGTLTPEERAAGRRIRSGDLLRIEDVDTTRNRCTVSFAGQRPPGVLP